jgi:hypothetical protein
MPRKYEIPRFLKEIVTQERYERWLKREALRHLRRDRRKRGNTSATNEEYKTAIHRAVVESGGRDSYTGNALNWSLISTYKNEASKSGGRHYRAQFALLPTVDHADDGHGPADFKICSCRTNDAKSDLTLAEFVQLCKDVVSHQSCPNDRK